MRTIAAVVTLAAIAIQMTRASAASLERFGFDFLTDSIWDPVHEKFGAFPFIYGTLVSGVFRRKDFGFVVCG